VGHSFEDLPFSYPFEYDRKNLQGNISSQNSKEDEHVTMIKYRSLINDSAGAPFLMPHSLEKEKPAATYQRQNLKTR
jgi:hypothetical protein